MPRFLRKQSRLWCWNTCAKPPVTAVPWPNTPSENTSWSEAERRKGFEPAASAIRNINEGYNAKIVTGVFNLFYYASRIIDEDSEDMYPHPAFADVDMRAKKEDRAKRMGLTMG